MGPIEDGDHPGYFYLYHTLVPGLRAQAVWESPPVRLHVGQPYSPTLTAYRTGNHLDAFGDLRPKAGPRYEQLVRSPLLKVDTDQSAGAYAALLPQLPAPALLHWVAFWSPSFDENYPDLLPPKPAFGTLTETVALFRAAQAAGFLNLPYTNPTWWDDEAPTFQGLVPTETAVLDRDGNPLYECYTGSAEPPPCTPENAARDSAFNASLPAYLWLHGGYVVSPHGATVQQRLAQLMHQMTGELPGDLVFEDQIGARALDFDYHPAAPQPVTYHSGWLEHTRVYSDHLLMTESGYDRLAETELGFHGSYWLPQVSSGAATAWWGAGNWQVYPLTAFLVRDKVLFYQHNLAPESFTTNLATLRWNLVTGYLLSYDLNASPYGGGLESPWLDLVAVVQSEVLSQYADELAVDFRWVAPEVSLTAFETFSVTANWNADTAYAVDAHRLSPDGVYVTNQQDTVAGLFDSYNGEPLSGTAHFIVEKRTGDALTVWQPLGTATRLTLRPPPGWPDQARVQVCAYGRDGQCLERHLITVVEQALHFTYAPVVNGVEVAYYRLVRVPQRLYLPVVLADWS